MRLITFHTQEDKSPWLAPGVDPAGGTPEEFARFIHDDKAKWSRPMKQAGITLE